MEVGVSCMLGKHCQLNPERSSYTNGPGYTIATLLDLDS